MEGATRRSASDINTAMVDIPLAIAQFVEQPSLRAAGTGRKGSIKRAAGSNYAKIFVEHDERLAHSVDDRVCER